MFSQVDGDTSTNDTVIALASGLSGSPSISSLNCSEAVQLQACLDAVCLCCLCLRFVRKQKILLGVIRTFSVLFQVMQGLAKSVAWDGEGATCLIEVCVSSRLT